MAKSYRLRPDIQVPFHFPDGSVLSDKTKVLTGPRWVRYCPEFLEEMADDSPARMLTEDVPTTTPSPATVEDESPQVEEAKNRIVKPKEEKATVILKDSAKLVDEKKTEDADKGKNKPRASAKSDGDKS